MSQAAKHPSLAACADGLPAIGLGQAIDGLQGMVIDSFENPSIGDMVRQGSLVAQMSEWDQYAMRAVHEEQERINQFKRMCGTAVESLGMHAARENLEQELRTVQAHCDEWCRYATRDIDAVSASIAQSVCGLSIAHWNDVAQDIASTQAAIKAAMPATDLSSAIHGSILDSLQFLEIGADFGNHSIAHAQIEEWHRHEREVTERFQAYTRMPDWVVDQALVGQDSLRQIIESTQSALSAAMPDISIATMGSTVFDELAAHSTLMEVGPDFRALGRLDWDEIEASAEQDIGERETVIDAEAGAANEAHAERDNGEQETLIDTAAEAANDDEAPPSFENDIRASMEIVEDKLVLIGQEVGSISERMCRLETAVEAIPARVKGSLAKRLKLGTAKWVAKRLVLAVMASSLTGSHHPQHTPPQVLRVVDRAIPNLREEPTRHSAIVKRLTRGSVLAARGHQGDWIAVTYADAIHPQVQVSGWVYGPMTKVIAPEILNTWGLEEKAEKTPTLH